MGELILKAVKVGLVILLIALAGNIIIQLTTVDFSGFDDALNLVKGSFIWSFLAQGIMIVKWWFGSAPIVAIVSIELAFFTFVIAGRFTDFIRRTFFN